MMNTDTDKKDYSKLVKVTEYHREAPTKMRILTEDPKYFDCYWQARHQGQVMAIKAVKQLFHDSTGRNVSVGTVHMWLEERHPETVRTNKVAYGAGKRVKYGRSSNNEFTTNGQKYVRTKFGWLKDYQAMSLTELAQNKGYDMVVHHIDGNHFNNSPDNLQVMPRALHTSKHISQWWNQQKLEQKKANGDPQVIRALQRIDTLLKPITETVS